MPSNQPSNAARWAELCEKYARGRSKSHEERFIVGRLAIHLRSEFAKACGCEDGYVLHYRYDHGQIPELDTSQKVTSGYDSASKTESGWAFGLGIQLESGPNTYPKTIIVIPITVKPRGESLSIESTVYSGAENVRLTADYSGDLQGLADRMFEGLSDALDRWVAGEESSSKFGFGHA